MAKESINTGIIANDGTGDTLRSAAQKINRNFGEIYAHLGGGDSANLSAQVSLDDSAVVFQGSNASDNFMTRINVTNPTKVNTATLPDSSGEVTLVSNTQTLSRKTMKLFSVGTTENAGNVVADSASPFFVGTKGSGTQTVTLHNGGTNGEVRYFANRGASNLVVTPDKFANGTSFTLKQNTAVQCIWDSGTAGTTTTGKWYLLGFDSDGTAIGGRQGITVT